MPEPEDTPLPITIVESPVPVPHCVHDDCAITSSWMLDQARGVAVVVCNDCPAQWTVDVAGAA